MKLFLVFALLALAFADEDEVKDVQGVGNVQGIGAVQGIGDVPDADDSVNDVLGSAADDSGEVLQEAASSPGLTYVHGGTGWPPYRQHGDDDDDGYGGDDDGYGGDSYGGDDDSQRRTYQVAVPDPSQYGPPRAPVQTPTTAYTSPARQPFTPPVVTPISPAPHVTYSPAPSDSHEQDDDDHQYYPPHKPRYYYAYGIKDSYSGVDLDANERRDGQRTEGSYSVVQPDGLRRVVTYWVDGDSGYNANVKYYPVPGYPQPNEHAQPGYAPHSVAYQTRAPVRPVYATGYSYMGVPQQPQYRSVTDSGCGYAPAMPVPVAQHRHDDDDYGGQSGYGYKLQTVGDDDNQKYGRSSYVGDRDDDDDYYRASKRTYFPWGYTYVGPQQADCKCHFSQRH